MRSARFWTFRAAGLLLAVAVVLCAFAPCAHAFGGLSTVEEVVAQPTARTPIF
jgi:hypothetical protein